MKNWIVLAFLFCALGVFAQPGNVPTEVINGKKYYVVQRRDIITVLDTPDNNF